MCFTGTHGLIISYRSQFVTLDLSRNNIQKKESRERERKADSCCGREDRWTNRAATCFYSSHTFTLRHSAFFNQNQSISSHSSPNSSDRFSFACKQIPKQKGCMFRQLALLPAQEGPTVRGRREHLAWTGSSDSLHQTHITTYIYTHTHKPVGRVGYWALGWQRHYRLPHKPLLVFTTSDICCLRLHVWIQNLH